MYRMGYLSGAVVRGSSVFHTVAQLIESSVVAANGAVGQVLDAFFDENSWRIRYLLIEVPGGPGDRTLLFSPEAVRGIDVDEGRLLVDRLPPGDIANPEKVESLRSLRQVLDCAVAGWTGTIGRTEDVVFEVESWVLRFLLVGLSDSRSDTVVLVHPDLIEEVQWERQSLRIAMTHLEVLALPDADVEITEALRRDRVLH